MAIYHFSAKVIGRSGGRSAIASAAYRAGERLHDDKLDREHDYTQKAGVVHREVMLPEGAPARWADRGTLWNEVEAGEKRKDAQLARDIEISLPRELGQAEAIQLARDFVREQFVARGMVADLNVHWTRAADGEVQPHAHVMLTMREVVLSQERLDASEQVGFGKKVVAWNDRALLGEWRERWASLANKRLAELGHDVQIDHRSYATRGIALEPQHKIGPMGTHRDPERALERAAEHQDIARRNGETIIETPGVALDAITRQQSTFTRRDLARFVDRHTVDRGQFDMAMAKAEAAPELVRLGQDGRGQERFTTRDMLEAEQRMERAAAGIAARDEHRVVPAAGWRALQVAARDGLTLGDEQRAAYRHVTSGPDLALVVGYAGTGKSALLGVARAAWQSEGLTVRGAALSGIAAEGLEAGSGMASRTLASLEFAWKQGRDLLSSRDVLVVDEAGLVGSRQMERVLSHAQAAGAKVVLIGDPEQLQAIEAGAAFRALAERHGAAEISEVRRQRADWQRDATRKLATERTAQALGRYDQAGMVHAAATRDDAKAALVAGWNAARLADAARRGSPPTSQVILAYTRDDVRELNGLAREHMRASGALRGVDQVVQTEWGERVFAAGDRLMFQRNERGLGGGGDGGGRDGVAVKNGTLGTVLEVASGGERLTVQLDGPGGTQAGRVVTFATRDYAHIDHGYAATIHKAQGVTVDRAHVLASQHMDRHAAYVALTRHRDGVALHYGQDEFKDAPALARTLGRQRLKDTSLDYEAERDGDALLRHYAERRGLDPLRPVSEIVLPVREAVSVAPVQRRSKFAGLNLRGSRSKPDREPTALEHVMPRAEPPPLETPDAQLARGPGDYARAWSDAHRMERAGLPVLPHQAVALERAGQALEETRPGLSRDVRAALARQPELAHGHGQPKGMAALCRAVDEERRERLALEERGWNAVRTWGTLERAYAAAEQDYDWQAKREVGARMKAFATELKRDPQLDGLLRQRGRELGVDEGSRLDRVVQAREADISRTLRHELGISLGRGMSMGM